MHSAWLRSPFLRVLKLLEIKERGPNFWGEQIFEKVWIIWSPFFIENFNSFLEPNFSSFIRFQCILHDSGVRFAECCYFYKLKQGSLISGGNKFCRKSELFGPPFWIYILKFLWPEIHSRSWDFNAFCLIQEYFSQSLEISRN